MESGHKFNVFEVFMLHSAPGGNSFGGIQAKHALENMYTDKQYSKPHKN